MKNFCAVIVTLLIILLSGCGGSSVIKKKQLAQTFLTQASLDISTYEEKNDIDSLHKALNNIDESLKYSPTSIAARGIKATLLFQLGKLQESKILFEDLLKEKKLTKAKRADTQNNYAIVLYQLGLAKEAEQTWLDLINNPHYISPELAYFNLGYTQLNEAARAYLEQQNPAYEQHLHSAISYFKNAVAISREYVDAFFFMGQAFNGLKKIDEARTCFQTILTINPEHARAQTMLKSLEAT